MEKIRVLIVDDSFFMRKVIRTILATDSALEVVGEAADGAQAQLQIEALRPKVVTLDIEMPGTNGLEALRQIMDKPHPPAVVMVSGYLKEGAPTTLECLRLGAVDFVIKPSGSFSLDMDTVQDSLLAKVKAAATVDVSKLQHEVRSPKTKFGDHAGDGIVIIGASTGGPVALESLLPALPADFPYPVVVAQHLPEAFTDSFISRLQKTCKLSVVRAEDAQKVDPGVIYIAPGGATTTLSRLGSHSVAFTARPNTKDIETPPVSVLMTSAADAYQAQTIGVILTGMGSDGATGMAAIKKAGGATVVQDKASSAVFGMGQEVVAAGAADQLVPLSSIAEKISELVST